MNSASIVKAPWKLNGKGYIILYKFKKDFVLKNGFIPENRKESFVGGLGAVMIVDYLSSDAGPYSEILFIPGKFMQRGRKKHMITKIYVSTSISVDSGIANWAIPKELADFNFISNAEKNKNSEIIRVEKNNVVFFEAQITSGGLPFPASTSFIPFPLTQEKPGQLLHTKFKGSGKGKLAKIRSIEVNELFFPDISSQKPLVAIKIDPFNIRFPEAIVEEV